MNWLIFIYFPVGCMGLAWAGSLVLQGSAKSRGLSLALTRGILLLFPFLLLAVSLGKSLGPGFWMNWASPLPFRGLVLLGILGLVGVRWVAEMVAGLALRWRVEGPDMEREASPEFLAALDYDRLKAGLAPRRGLAWGAGPRLCLSKAASPAHLTSGLRPRICLDASLVPARYRDSDLWWQSVFPAPGLVADSLAPLQAVVAHELAHFKRGDHLRTLLTLATGAVLPWEWLFGQVSLDKFPITGTWLFKQWSRFMNEVGLPVRRWLKEEHGIREAMADEEAHIMVPGANRHLREVRALYPAVPPEPAQDSHLGLPPLGGALGILALGGAILWAAPGRVPYLSTFGDGTVSTRLPEGWCLALEGRSKASGVYIPGHRAAGRILVVCRQIDPGHPPQLRTVGRQRPDAIPVPCKVEVRWEVRFIGDEPLAGDEAVLSLTQSGALMRENQDLLAAYSIPENPPERLDDGWVRYPLAIWVEGEPQMDLLFICYTFPAPGRYLFKPPVLTLVRPGGERQDYPGL